MRKFYFQSLKIMVWILLTVFLYTRLVLTLQLVGLI